MTKAPNGKTYDKIAISYEVYPYNDADYLHRLSPEELQWYKQFVDEYYQGCHYEQGGLHNKEQIVQCWRRLNAARRDILSVSSAKFNAEVSKKICRRYSAEDYKFTKYG